MGIQHAYFIRASGQTRRTNRPDKRPLRKTIKITKKTLAKPELSINCDTFKDSIPVIHPAGDAVCMALAMRDKMQVFCAKWQKLGNRVLFGVGISFDYNTVGIVGSAGRFDCTASGTSINMAVRLCNMATRNEVLISPRMWAAVEGVVDAVGKGEVEMKGIREPVEAYAVVSEKHPTSW